MACQGRDSLPFADSFSPETKRGLINTEMERIVCLFFSGKRVLLENAPLKFFRPDANRPPAPPTFRNRALYLHEARDALDKRPQLFLTSYFRPSPLDRLYATSAVIPFDLLSYLKWLSLRKWKPYRPPLSAVPYLSHFL